LQKNEREIPFEQCKNSEDAASLQLQQLRISRRSQLFCR
jgi:hypothetical protein